MKDFRVYLADTNELATDPAHIKTGTQIYIDGAWYEITRDCFDYCAVLLRDGLQCPSFHALIEYRDGCWEVVSYMQGNPNETCNLDYYEENYEEKS